MLTVDYGRLGVRPGDRLLDLGCGFGRHAFEAARMGASVVALDAGPEEVAQVRATLGAMVDAGELAADHPANVGQGDALALPFAEATFDRVIASEVLELIVIGRPNEGGRVDKAITRLGLTDVVRCVSGISDEALARLYGEAEVAVVPSLYEGFSLPAVEAMACGVAVVATTGGALPEVVGAHEETGLLVPPDDPGALAQAIGRLMDEPALRARLGAAGRRRVMSRFTWQVTAQGTAECYQALLEGRPLPGAPGTGSPEWRTAEGDAENTEAC